MRYYVYCEYIKNRKTDFCMLFDKEEDAVKHIAKCYTIDKNLGQLGEYYYYIIKR